MNAGLASENTIELISVLDLKVNERFEAQSTIELTAVLNLSVNEPFQSSSTIELISILNLSTNEPYGGDATIQLLTEALLGIDAPIESETNIELITAADLTVAESVSEIASETTIELISTSELTATTGLETETNIQINATADLFVNELGALASHSTISIQQLSTLSLDSGLASQPTIQIVSLGTIETGEELRSKVLIAIGASAKLTRSRLIPPFTRTQPICCDNVYWIGCLRGCDFLDTKILAEYTGQVQLRYIFNNKTRIEVIDTVNEQNILIPNIFNENKTHLIQLIKEDGTAYEINGIECFVFESRRVIVLDPPPPPVIVRKLLSDVNIKLLTTPDLSLLDGRLYSHPEIRLITDSYLSLLDGRLYSNTEIVLLTEADMIAQDMSLQSHVTIVLLVDADMLAFNASLQSNTTIVLNTNADLTEEPCEDLDLTPFVTYSDECTYFITGEHPDTGLSNKRRSTPIADTITIRHEWLMKYQSSCQGILYSELNEAIGNGFGSRYSHIGATPIGVGGFHISMKLRNYDAVLNTESIITVPLSPTTAILTGCGGTALAANLTFNGSNGAVMAAAHKIVTENYLCTLGYSNGVEYLFTSNGNQAQTIGFFHKHLPATRWIGIRSTSQETEPDAFVYDRDGTGNIINSTSISTFSTNIANTLTQVSPCGNVTRTQSFNFTRQITQDNWRNVVITDTAFTGTPTDLQQTCPINLYQFDPPECEGATWFWQYSFDGVEPYVTVQIGGEFFEPEDQGYYRLLYICDGCEYEYFFTFFIF